MGRRRSVPQALLTFLIVMMAAAGCAGAGGPAAVEATGGSGDAAGSGESASTDQASTREAPPEHLPQEREGQYDRPRFVEESRAEAAYSSGGAYVPAGFGQGSLWATELATCDDTGEGPPPGPYDDGSVAVAAACAAPASMSLKRLDPETGEEEAAVELGDFFANVTEVAFGAGSVWVSPADYHPGPDPDYPPGGAVLRVDPGTNRVVGRTPVSSPSGVDFGHGSVWVTSAGSGTLSRIDPDTGEVVAKIEVGRGAVDVAVDERGGAVWVAGLHLPEDFGESLPPEHSEARKLSRVDPKTNRVVAEVPIGANSPTGGAQSVEVGEGAVWAASVGGELLKVDPETNRVVAATRLGAYSSDLAVSGDSVWATAQTSGPGNVGTRLVRMAPRALEVLSSLDLGPPDSGGYGRLAADAVGHVWFVTGGAGTRTGTLARISP